MKCILAACALLMAGAWASGQVNGQGGVYINGVLQGGGGSTYSYLWSGGISMLAPTTDAAPDPLLLRAANAWPGAATNTAGANTILAGAIGRRFFTIVDYAHGSMAGSEVTITATVLGIVQSLGFEEGDNWNAATTNAATATSLAAAINVYADTLDLDAAAVGAVVRLTPRAGTHSLTIAKTAADAGMTATSGTDGIVKAGSPRGIVDAAGLRFDGTEYDNYWYLSNNTYSGSPPGHNIQIYGGAPGSWGPNIQINSSASPQYVTLGSDPGTGSSRVMGIRFHNDAGISWGYGNNLAIERSANAVAKITDGGTGYGALSLDTNTTQWDDTVALSDGAKTAVVDIAIADGEFIGGTLTYTITSTDATDHQALTGIVGFSGVRKNGTPDTYHLTIAESASPVLAESAGASTLTDTWAIDAGTNVATISVTADSSLTTPTMTVRYQLSLNSANVVTKK